MANANAPIALDGLASGAALVTSGAFPWVGSGSGSSLRGMELAAALRSASGLPDWAPRVAIAILVVAAVGLAHLASAMSVSVVAARFRLLTGLLLVLGLAWVASRYSPERWGLGLAFVSGGASIAVGAGMWRELRLVAGQGARR